MMQLSRWKVTVVIAMAVFGLLFAAPNLIPAQTRESLPSWVPAKTLNLGLDLQGGSYLLLEVNTQTLKRDRQVKLVEDIRNTLQTEKIAASSPVVTGDTVRVRITDPAQVAKAYEAINTITQPIPGEARDYNLTRGDNQTIAATAAPDSLNAAASRAVQQSIEIVRKRIDALGTREPTIMRQGANRIVVAAPGESDPERLKEVIGKTARLTFQMVDVTVSPEEAAAGIIPPGSEILPGDDFPTGVVVRRRAVITGEMLTSAKQTFDENNQPAVSLRFNSQGARRFGDATAQNIGKPFAIVLDGRVISTPVIQGAIPGGTGQITNMGDIKRANNLAIQLSAGALPTELTVEEQRTVTAELGADAVNAGKTATLVAFLGVLVFMILAYGFLFGGISVVALVVNGLLIIAAMSMTQATLSLPGIAGLILTLAMAVDANVLIYERMRDEARAGRTAIMSMESGFKSAMVTIIDANLTTLIAAWIMFIFGAGPVRGFAWTLSIGVITSVLTSVLITQVLLGLWFRVKRPKTLPIG